MTALARWLSVVGHPFVMVAVMVAATSLRLASPAQAARIVGLVLLVAVVPVALLMLRQVRRGRWDNADASNARERPILFAVSAGAVLVLLGCLHFFQPQSFLVRGAAGTLVMLAVCAASTRWLKVSLHLAFAALATTILLLLGSLVGWFLLAFLPPLAWSRLRLARHQPLEVVAGFLIGVAAGLAVHGL
jgi:membrane-associated phospholipid phosphatase